jgi:hypothetical protein
MGVYLARANEAEVATMRGCLLGRGKARVEISEGGRHVTEKWHRLARWQHFFERRCRGRGGVDGFREGKVGQVAKLQVHREGEKGYACGRSVLFRLKSSIGPLGAGRNGLERTGWVKGRAAAALRAVIITEG